MIPGWTRHWKRIFNKEHNGWNMEMAKRLFTRSGYERSLLVPNGILSEAEMKENIEEFNRLLGFRTETRPGTLDLLKQALEAAKTGLEPSGSGTMTGPAVVRGLIIYTASRTGIHQNPAYPCPGGGRGQPSAPPIDGKYHSGNPEVTNRFPYEGGNSLLRRQQRADGRVVGPGMELRLSGRVISAPGRESFEQAFRCGWKQAVLIGSDSAGDDPLDPTGGLPAAGRL